MNRQFIILLFSIYMILGCRNDQKNIRNEIIQINNATTDITFYQIRELEGFNLTNPDRYHYYYLEYKYFEKKLIFLNNLLDSIHENNIYRLSEKDLKNFNETYILIDSIYSPRIYTKTSELDTIIEKNKVNKYLNPIKEKTLKSLKSYDFDLIKLYLNLINREIIDFILYKALEGTIPINYLEPVTIKENDLINCYLTCMDTCLNPMILIGQFDHLKYDQDVYFKERKIYDTVYFLNGKATIEFEQLDSLEAILYYYTRYGIPIKKKININTVANTAYSQ